MNLKRLAVLVVLFILAVTVFIYCFYQFKYKDIYSATTQKIKIAVYFVFVLILSINFALLEINIEGKAGWAKKLPTWVLDTEKITKIFGGRPMTGYHVIILFFLLPFLLHFPVFFTKWSLQKEAVVIGTYFLFLVVEDFMWFVLNPDFGLKKFKPKKIWWHKNWIWRIPDDYIGGILIAVIFLSCGLPGL